MMNAEATSETERVDATSRTARVDLADLPARVRWLRAVRALRKILANPEDTETVLEFTNVANAGRRRRDERLGLFFAHPDGARLFRERRKLDSRTVAIDALAALPVGTLGHAYARFMKAHGITPNIFDGAPEGVTDERASYFMQRMRQTHDLWHVVTNCETDPAGEIALQAFTFAQVRAPASAILAALGTLRALPYSRQVLPDALAMYRVGHKARPLPLFAWEDHWETPLVEVRRMLALPTEPAVTGGYLTDALAA
jgi:ubiquinone biosynthesis protein Coq4